MCADTRRRESLFCKAQTRLVWDFSKIWCTTFDVLCLHPTFCVENINSLACLSCCHRRILKLACLPEKVSISYRDSVALGFGSTPRYISKLTLYSKRQAIRHCLSYGPARETAVACVFPAGCSPPWAEEPPKEGPNSAGKTQATRFLLQGQQGPCIRDLLLRERIIIGRTRPMTRQRSPPSDEQKMSRTQRRSDIRFFYITYIHTYKPEYSDK